MNDRENRRHQMFVRVSNFAGQHVADFAANSVGAQLFNTLNGVIDNLQTHGAKETSGTGLGKQGTVTRAQAREALRDDLEAIRRTARAMSAVQPGLPEKFRVPREDNDEILVTAARAFLVEATPLSAQFIAHELPADFLEDLENDIAALEVAISTQTVGKGHRIAASAAIDETIDEGVKVVKRLDAIVKNKYANNSSVLAEWTSASHTERAPRRQQEPEPPNPPPPG